MDEIDKVAEEILKVAKSLTGADDEETEEELSSKAQDFVDEFDKDTATDFLKQIGFDLADVRDFKKQSGGGYEIRVGSQEYIGFKSHDDARDYAIDRVRDDVENDPSVFSDSFFEDNIDKSKAEDFFREVYTEWDESYCNDIMSERSSKGHENRLVDELLEADIIDEDDVTFDPADHFDDLKAALKDKMGLEKWLVEAGVVEEADTKEEDFEPNDHIEDLVKEWENEGDINEKLIEFGVVTQEDVDKVEYDGSDHIDELVESMVEDKISEGNGGYDHYKDNFGEEEARKLLMDNHLIDTDSAAEDAVDSDGVEHFLNHYDGNVIEAGDSCWYRQN